jgi:Na+/H+ antiporter NhaD/arsenite permease-like protein
VPAAPPVRPIARLAWELRTTGAVQLALGLACLIVALTSGDISAGRAVVPFVVVLVVVGALSHHNTGWMRRAQPAPADPRARVEERSLTLRRSLVGCLLAVVAVVIAVTVGPQFGGVLGGVVAGVGAVDLRNYLWVTGRERSTGHAIFRELGPSPFAGGRRPLYTLPT